MKIHVNAIPMEGMDLEKDIMPLDLNLETKSVYYSDKVHLKVHAERDKDILSADCYLKTTKTQICSKCTAEFESIVEKKEKFIYQLTGEHVVDLSDDIKDTIILDYSIRPLCKQDCKGLCAECGNNQNIEQCNCKVKKWRK